MKPLAKPGKAAAKVPQRRKQARYRKRVAQERRARAGGAKAGAKRALKHWMSEAVIDLDRPGNHVIG